MFVATSETLPDPSILQRLSAGATKLLMAIMAEPDRPQARYIELVGKSVRSVRNYGQELLRHGLVRRTTPVSQSAAQPAMPATARPATKAPVRPKAARLADDPLAAFDEAQRARYMRLRELGIWPAMAVQLVPQCDDALINAALAYVATKYCKNQSGYLIWCLTNPTLWHNIQAPDAQSVPPLPFLTDLDDVPVPSSARVSPVVDGPAAEPIGEADLLPSDIPQAARVDHAVLPVDVDAVSPIAATPDPLALVPKMTAEHMVECVLMAYAIESSTGLDVRLNSAARRAVYDLVAVGYTAEAVGITVDDYFPRDWRGQKGELPTLPAILDLIALTRHDERATDRDIGRGLLYRVQAIRRYGSLTGMIRQLTDLWSPEVQAAASHADWEARCCPDCKRPYSMCQCDQPQVPMCPYALSIDGRN